MRHLRVKLRRVLLLSLLRKASDSVLRVDARHILECIRFVHEAVLSRPELRSSIIACTLLRFHSTTTSFQLRFNSLKVDAFKSSKAAVQEGTSCSSSRVV